MGKRGIKRKEKREREERVRAESKRESDKGKQIGRSFPIYEDFSYIDELTALN